MKRALLAGATLNAAILLQGVPARAQTPTVVTACGALALTPGYSNGQLTVDQTGLLCDKGGIGTPLQAGGSINEAQLGGINISLGSGATDAGTQRVVLGATEPVLTAGAHATQTLVSLPAGTTSGTQLATFTDVATFDLRINGSTGTTFWVLVSYDQGVSSTSLPCARIDASQITSGAALVAGSTSGLVGPAIVRCNLSGPATIYIGLAAPTVNAVQAQIEATSAGLPIPYTNTTLLGGSVTALRYAATTTASAFTGSATANTFTSALASSATRRGCTIYSANAFSVAPGASPSAGAALPVAAGQTFKCADSALVMTDQINVSSATVSNTYVVWSQ